MALTTIPASLSATALTLTTAAQPNITSVGTLTGLTVSGNASVTANLPTFTITGQGRVNGFEIAGTSGDTTLTEKSNNGITLGTNNTSRLRIQNNGDISFYEDTGTTPKFFWDSSTESLGIGTTPAHKLHVADATTPEIIVEDTTNNVKAVLGADNSVGRIGTDTNHPVTFRTNDTERMRIDSSGNVGITGQTSPTFNLDGGFVTQTWGWHLNTSYQAGFTYTTTDRSLSIFTKSADNADYIKFSTGGSATERMRIDFSGNLGLGMAPTTNNISKSISLVNGGSIFGYGSGTYITGNSNYNGAWNTVATGPDSRILLDGNVIFSRSSSASAGSQGTVSESMRIDSSGDVLIGSTTNLNVLSGTPKLQIGSGTGHASLQFYSGTSSVNGIYFGDTSNANVDRYDGYIEYQHANRLISFRASGINPLTIKSTGPLLPAGNFGYHTTQEHYTASTPATSYSSASNITYNSSTQYWPDQGEKQICVINARAYTNYIHIKTNLTANNIMFYFRTKGYFYAVGCEEQLIGGYTYTNNSVISKDNQTVAGNTHTGDTYRASDGSLVLKMHVNQIGYTEGKMLVFFHAHAPSTTSGLTVTHVTQKDDGTNAF